MEKANKLIKQALLFFAIFIAVQFVFSLFQDDNKDLAINSGNVLFATTKDSFSSNKDVTVRILNGTSEDLVIPNECPNEPFDVYKKENNTWIQKSATPTLDCSNAEDTVLAPTKETRVIYDNWNHALFGEKGIFKISFTTEIEGKETTLETNEFTIKEPGVLSQLWTGVFYRLIYNGLIFLISVMPGHSLGLAIILLTLIIRFILLVPSGKAMKAQKKMKDIQPKLDKLKEKYKGDQQRIAMETMTIWKEAKVSPMSSCLPLLFQFPFLIAIFYVVKSGLNPDNTYLLYSQYANFSLSDINTSFLWMNLTQIDKYILPLTVGGLQFLQMQLSLGKSRAEKKKKKAGKKEKSQQEQVTNTMTFVMPAMIALFTASLPAGVGIYWGVSTAFGCVQQLVINNSKDTGSSNDEVKVKVIKSN